MAQYRAFVSRFEHASKGQGSLEGGVAVSCPVRGMSQYKEEMTESRMMKGQRNVAACAAWALAFRVHVTRRCSAILDAQRRLDKGAADRPRRTLVDARDTVRAPPGNRLWADMGGPMMIDD